MELNAKDKALLAALEDGLPLDPRPYARIGERIGLGEREVMDRLAALRERGAIRRFGVVVRHWELGYRANAMVVWDVRDSRVTETGHRIADMNGVTLCYRRPRRLPDWPYNLFCMVHGRDRDAVQSGIERITAEAGLEGRPRVVLFSRRRFKQRGARYGASECPGRAETRAEA
jgi:DNA-binding Lrp family transcriptional regulator